ncbi:LLM class flavin-dependent oxidoreductase [Streptomyces sp. NBC_00448]|uniref:LLM class flavin-dependent oxidoreductase n=1 Tax=Streptomyces sp. NBC_00448 TaxID=2903652 RepID=UPI002E204BE7
MGDESTESTERAGTEGETAGAGGRAGLVAAVRAALGPVGAVLPVSFTGLPPIDVQRAGAGRLEQAGYRTAWTNEVVGGKDALVQASMLLAATRELVLGTSIANIWARSPQTLHAAASQLAEAYPGRFVLGVGGGYPQQAEAAGRAFGSPLATMRDYLDRMDGPTQPPAPAADYLRIVGANGPKMLALAGEASDGALPVGVPPQYTAYTRQLLGPDKLLVVGMTVVPDQDRERARTGAREMAAALLARPSFAAIAAQIGLAGPGDREPDDELVDALVGHGDPDAIAATARRHLAAGADHVVLMLQPGGEFTDGVAALEELAPALTALD